VSDERTNGSASARPDRLRRFGFALACAGLAIAGSAALLPLTDEATYAPLVGMAAVVTYAAGLGSALAAVSTAWLITWVAITSSAEPWRIGDRQDFIRWLVALAIALVVVWLVWVVQRAQRTFAARAHLAEVSESTALALQALAGDLSAAVTPGEVAHALVEHVPPLLGATGGSLGLVEGDQLVIVDPSDAPRASLPPGLRLPLTTRAPIVRAAVTGRPTHVDSRARFVREFPDGARLATYAEGALAVPLDGSGGTIGAMGFPFARAGAIDADVVALAELAAGLGAQALERARLYEHERGLREGLDRIARLAPRFGGESTEAVLAAICREASGTFGCDAAQIWGLGEEHVEVLWREPPDAAFVPGTRVEVADMAGLRDALDRREPLFVADAPANARGEMLDRIRRAGTRSVLRVPIAIGGHADRILSLIWRTVTPPPAETTLALARRFGDHAGLAIEQVERRRAERAAADSAERAQRLLDATFAIGIATEPEQIATAILEETIEALGAAAGAVVTLNGDELVLSASLGYTQAEAERWRRLPVAAELPVAQAFRAGELVLHPSREDLADRYPELARETRHGGWVALPLVVGERTIGALTLSFATTRDLRPAEREYLLALGLQAAQALDRAMLHETEHRARERAEQLAGDLAQLHAFSAALDSATTTDEVARVVCERVNAIAWSESAALYGPAADGALGLLGQAGRAERAWPTMLRIESGEPAGALASLWLRDDRDWARHPEHRHLRADGGVVSLVPLVVQGEPVGALAVRFAPDRTPGGAERRLIETMARQATQPLDRLRLLESERAARAEAELAASRTRSLHDLAGKLNLAVTPAEVAETLATETMKTLSVAGALVYTATQDGADARLLAVASTGPDVLDRWRTMPLRESAPVTDAITTGRPVAMPSAETMRDRYASLHEGEILEQASYCFPLTVGAGTVGALYFTFEAPTTLEPGAWAMVQGIARQGGQALERSRLYENELRARTRTEGLHSLTAALSAALTPDEVASAFVAQATAAAGAHGAALTVVDGNERLAALAWRGYPDEIVDPWLAHPVSEPLPGATVMRVDRPLFFETAAELRRAFPALAAEIDALSHESFAVLPVTTGVAAGVATLSWRHAVPLDEEHRAFLEAIASQCGLALDRALRYESERRIAETLQRSVLPETVPSMEGVKVVARYLPGTSALEVGGDWFDTLTLDDGRLGFVVGDVAGKGIGAAATMAQLRNAMRALTLDDSTPELTVARLNRFLEGLMEVPFATLAYLALDPTSRDVTLVSAGHLPPLVLTPRGEVTYLEEGRGLPLGIDPDAEYVPWRCRLEPGATLVLYTDGLVERRDRSIDAGLARLASVAERAAREPEAFIDTLVDELLGTGPRGDDVAVLAVRLDTVPLDALSLVLPSTQESLVTMRVELQAWLERADIPDRDARDTILAAWEAGANAVEHAGSPEWRITAELARDRIRLEVADDGHWKEPRRRQERGLGLRLIEGLMTDVRVERSPDGTTVAMERAVMAEAASAGAGHASYTGDP
jgi:serine phosphatase RsbU (regulator of sigma subunit)/transcriptional regulator with GAF, ATPase, and Fis domain/anti-sigma regulatory factor (Ser/Thr protein kinase)